LQKEFKENKDLRVYREKEVLKEKLGHKVSKVLKVFKVSKVHKARQVRKVHRGHKANRGLKEFREYKGRKEILVCHLQYGNSMIIFLSLTHLISHLPD
jgi:hypothetical protein